MQDVVQEASYKGSNTSKAWMVICKWCRDRRGCLKTTVEDELDVKKNYWWGRTTSRS